MKIFPEDMMIGDIITAEEFLSYQQSAKSSYSEVVQAKITIRTIEELTNSTCVSFCDGAGMLCVNQYGDIESVLKRADADIPGFLNVAFANAIALGGNRLDCYNCAGAVPGKGSSLGDSYCRRGFIPICRIRFNRLYVDPIMAKTYGEPEIIFFIYCGDPLPIYWDKVKNGLYPGLDDYYDIPYIDTIQEAMGLASNDMDYDFANSYRNMMCSKWYGGLKIAFANNFDGFIQYYDYDDELLASAMDAQFKIEEEINIAANYVPPTEEELQASFARFLESVDADDYMLKPTDPVEDFADLIPRLEQENLPESTHKYHFVEDTTIRYDERLYFTDYESDVVTLCSEDIDGKITILHEFTDELVRLTEYAPPIFSITDDKIWFIDKTDGNVAQLYSIDINTGVKNTRDIPVVPDTISLLPIVISDEEIVFFYHRIVSKDDYLDDLTIVKISGNEIVDSTRIGSIIGLNPSYLYCEYDIGRYRLDYCEFKKIPLTTLFDELDKYIFKYIDASRDLIYFEMIDISDIDQDAMNTHMEYMNSHIGNGLQVRGDLSAYDFEMPDTLPALSLSNDIVATELRHDMFALNHKGELTVYWKKPHVDYSYETGWVRFCNEYLSVTLSDKESIEEHRYNKFGEEIE